MNGKVLRQSLSVCLLAGGILAVLVAGVWALEARAQEDEPVCPPGFEWQRMSGVGCVQADCYDVDGRLSYTSACICGEGMKPCSEPVDYANFDQALCGIHCPGHRVTACVPLEEFCPGEEPPPEPPPTELPPEPPPPEPFVTEQPFLGDPGQRERVEDFITGGHHHPPTPGRAAAAAITGTVLFGLWSLVQGIGGQAPPVGKSGASGSKEPAAKQGAETPEQPDLRGTAGGLVKDVSSAIDKWPKGSSGEEDETVRRSVFYGEDVRLILIGMGKLPAGTTQSERMLIGEGGFAAFSGAHPNGEMQLIRLVSGREILVAEVLSVGYEGVVPTSNVSVEIDFSHRLTLVARLVEDDLEAPTLRAADMDDSEVPTIKRDDIEDEGKIGP